MREEPGANCCGCPPCNIIFVLPEFVIVLPLLLLVGKNYPYEADGMSYCYCLAVGKPLLRLAAVCRVVAVGTFVMPRGRGGPPIPTAIPPFTYSLLFPMLLLMFYRCSI